MCGTILGNIERKARTRHFCDMCCQPILPGERYNRQTIVDDFISTWDAHVECWADAQRLIPTSDFDGCFENSSLVELIRDSGEAIGNHDLTPIVAGRIRRTEARSEAYHQRWSTDFYASTYPYGRWADDGGPADARA